MPSQNSGRMYAGTKPGKVERVLQPAVLRHLRGCCCRSRASAALPLEGEHRLDLHRHRALRRLDVPSGRARAAPPPRRASSRAADSRSTGRARDVWSVTTSGQDAAPARAPGRRRRRCRAADGRAARRLRRAMHRERLVEVAACVVEVARRRAAARCASDRPRPRAWTRPPWSPRAAARRPCRRARRSASTCPARSPPKCCRPTATNVS